MAINQGQPLNSNLSDNPNSIFKNKKGQVSKTFSLYVRFKALKDRNRDKLILKVKEEEKNMKKKAMKKGFGSEQLQKLNSFQK